MYLDMYISHIYIFINDIRIHKNYSHPSVSTGLVPGPPADTKLRRSSRPLYKMAHDNGYSWPSTSMDSQHLD